MTILLSTLFSSVDAIRRRPMSALTGSDMSMSAYEDSLSSEEPNFASERPPQFVSPHAEEWDLKYHTLPLASKECIGKRNMVWSKLPFKETILRVKQFLKQHSIAVELKKRKGEVLCETRKHLKFSIRFFRSVERHVVVRTERRIGCAYEMHAFRRLFYPLIAIGYVTARRSQRNVASSIRRLSEDQKSCNESHCGFVSDDSHCREAIERCRQLCLSEKADDQRKGLEVLSCIMSPGCGERKAAECVSTALLLNDGSSCGDLFRSIMLKHLCCAVGEVSTSPVQRRASSAALAVLGNALDLWMTIRARYDASPDASFLEETVEPLKLHVSAASCRPHEAAMALKCMSAIARLNENMLQSVDGCNMLPVLVHALENGRRSHGELELRAEELMEVLGQDTFLNV